MRPPILIFNKPFGVLSQFTDADKRKTLAHFIDSPGYYPAGRLDKDSEGLMVLTNDGALQQKISSPKFKLLKTYLIEVEGIADTATTAKLTDGVLLKDGPAKAVYAKPVERPTQLWVRDPPVRFRQNIPTSWIEIGLKEGRNRQVRRMSASVGLPTLRLVRTAIGRCTVWPLALGEYAYIEACDIFDKA